MEVLGHSLHGCRGKVAPPLQGPNQRLSPRLSFTVCRIGRLGRRVHGSPAAFSCARKHAAQMRKRHQTRLDAAPSENGVHDLRDAGTVRLSVINSSTKRRASRNASTAELQVGLVSAFSRSVRISLAAASPVSVRLDRAPQRGAAFAITRASRRARTRSIGCG